MVNISILEDEYGLTQDFLRRVLGDDMGAANAAMPAIDGAATDEAPKEKNGILSGDDDRPVSPVLINPPDPKDEDPSDNLARRLIMRQRIRSRIDEGMMRNFANYRLYFALDQALDTPFRQITPTLVQSLIDKQGEPDGEKKMLDAFQDLGLNQMLSDEIDPKTNHKTGKKVLNMDTFVKAMVPLTIAYVTARWAAICNDAEEIPFLKYEPAVLRTDYRVKCEALSDRIGVMDRQMNYREAYKQAVFRLLHYGQVYQFPMEEWYKEKQLAIARKDDVVAGVENEDGEPAKENDFFWQITKEGLRYHHPHPSRTYRDLAHPACNFNTDTGPTFAGYWRITRFRDIAFNPAYYNTSEIALADRNIMDLNRIFFQTVYGACTLQFPTLTMGNEGVSELDREKRVAVLYYGVDHYDQGILVTEHWEKLNPKRDGLVNPDSERGLDGYDGDVWFRFVVAGTNGTILYAAPVPSVGPLYAGYDADEARSMNQSLTLQVIPFTDHIGNVLTQMLLSMRQNLANLILIDTDMVDDGAVDAVIGAGERFLRKLNILRFSGMRKRKATTMQMPAQAAVQNFSFPKANLQEHVQTIQMLINILERLLGVSSQEVSQAASHEQSAEEILALNKSSSNRLMFTKLPLARFKDAWKIQLYNYLMTYGSESFWCEIPCDATILPETLKALGFDLEEMGNDADGVPIKHGEDKVIRVRFGPKVTPVPEWAFASTREDQDRYNDPQIAVAMTQWLQALLANPLTAQAIGAQQAIMAANVIAQYAGLPRDFQMRALTLVPGQQQDPQAMLQTVMNAVMQKLAPALQDLGGQVKQVSGQVGQIAQNSGAVQKAVGDLSSQNDQNRAAISKILQAMSQGQMPTAPSPNPDAGPIAQPAQPAATA